MSLFQAALPGSVRNSLSFDLGNVLSSTYCMQPENCKDSSAAMRVAGVPCWAGPVLDTLCVQRGPPHSLKALLYVLSVFLQVCPRHKSRTWLPIAQTHFVNGWLQNGLLTMSSDRNAAVLTTRAQHPLLVCVYILPYTQDLFLATRDSAFLGRLCLQHLPVGRSSILTNHSLSKSSMPCLYSFRDNIQLFSTTQLYC